VLGHDLSKARSTRVAVQRCSPIVRPITVAVWPSLSLSLSLIGDGPIFWEVDGYVDWWRLDVGDLGFESTRFGPRNHYTTAPLVINQTQLD
jgi:hypothetical protein